MCSSALLAFLSFVFSASNLVAIFWSCAGDMLSISGVSSVVCFSRRNLVLVLIIILPLARRLVLSLLRWPVARCDSGSQGQAHGPPTSPLVEWYMFALLLLPFS